MHILEFSDILDYSEDNKNQEVLNTLKQKENEIKFQHFNPNNLKHSCPSLNENNQNEENYHFGDLGNIIADSQGKAFLSLQKKIDIKSLNGRVVVISNSPDNCLESNEFDKLADIISFSALTAVKSKLNNKENNFLNSDRGFVNREIDSYSMKINSPGNFEKERKFNKLDKVNKINYNTKAVNSGFDIDNNNNISKDENQRKINKKEIRNEFLNFDSENNKNKEKENFNKFEESILLI